MGHLLENVAQFIRLLRRIGLLVPAGSTAAAVQALANIDIGRPQDVRLALRTVLIRRPEDLAGFDQAFRAFWGRPAGSGGPLDARPLGSERRFGEPVIAMETLSGAAAGGGQSRKAALERVRISTYSEREVLREKDFKRLTAEELSQAVKMLRELRWRPAPRRTGRWRKGAGKTPDLRALLERLARRDIDPGKLPTRTGRFAPRRLVLLCDISGSMERYSRMLLWFACCLSGALGRVEAFLFATRLTRITTQLRTRPGRDPFREVARLAPDWSGGTRIGKTLRTFHIEWSERVLGQGAVVLVVSDGWDRGDPDLLQREVSRLQRSCQRLIWLSPLLGDPAYEPLTRGLQAALPHVDDFLPAHNLASLEHLALHLNRLAPGSRPGLHRQGVLC